MYLVGYKRYAELGPSGFRYNVGPVKYLAVKTSGVLSTYEGEQLETKAVNTPMYRNSCTRCKGCHSCNMTLSRQAVRAAVRTSSVGGNQPSLHLV